MCLNYVITKGHNKKQIECIETGAGCDWQAGTNIILVGNNNTTVSQCLNVGTA